MFEGTRWRIGFIALFSIAALTLASGATTAGDKKKPSDRHDLSVLNETLKDVITKGADIFNKNGDHAGCYRLWQGSLMSIRPFVPPDMQKSIDKGLASADKMDTYADRAFELRKVLDDIRNKTRSKDDKKDDDKKDDKKDDRKKKKKDDDKASESGERGQIAGKITLQGKPLTGGYFVTLISDSKSYSSTVQKDGTFQFKTSIPPGNYRVAIETIPDEKLKSQVLPARYSSAESSALVVQVKEGKNQFDFDLTK